MKKTAIINLIALALLLGFAMPVLAQPTTNGSNTRTGDNTSGQNTHTGDNVSGQNTHVDINATLNNPFSGGSTLDELFKKVINNIILPLGGVIAVLSFIYSGFLYVMAQGNETKIKQASAALLYSAIGTAILMGAWVIANVISTTLNSLKSS